MNQEYNFTIPGKEDINEPIIIFNHRHIVSFLGPILIAFFIAILPLILWLGLFQSVTFTGINIDLIIIFTAIYYLVLAMITFFEWLTYYYDILIVTTTTLIEIDQKNIFYRQISHVDLRQVEDISSEIKGILPTIFSYGNVIIQTAGPQELTIIRYIPNPQQVAATILKLHKDVLGQEKD